MALPGDDIEVGRKHVAMRDGRKVIKIEAKNQRGDKIIDGTPEVHQPPSAYVFIGQGSQEVGMGMDLYNVSPVARPVWDAADAHLTLVFLFLNCRYRQEQSQRTYNPFRSYQRPGHSSAIHRFDMRYN